MVLGDLKDYRVAHKGTARQRRPGNDLNVAARTEVERACLTVAGVKFDLVDPIGAMRARASSGTR